MKLKLFLLVLFLLFKIQAGFTQSNLVRAVQLKKEALTEYNNKNYQSSLNKISKAINLLKEEGRKAPSEMITLRDRAKSAIKLEEEKKAEDARKKAAAQKAREERAAKEARFKKEQEVAKYEPEIRSELSRIDKLVEGRVYLISSSKITSSNSEKSYFFCYGDRYVIVTIPDEQVVKRMNKSSLSFDSNDAQSFSDYVTSVRVKSKYGKTNYSFKKSIHYSNVFLGGSGDDLLWHGQQYVNFDQDVHYYYYTTKLHADIEMKEGYEKEYFMPYLQTGRLSRMVDYDFVVKDSLVEKLRDYSFSDFKSTSSDKIKVKITPKGHTSMLFVTKKIKYQLFDEGVTGSYSGGGYKYTKGFLYFTPKSSSSHYAFIQHAGLTYKTSDLLSKLKSVENSIEISKANFDSIFESYNEHHNDYRYFTDSNYTLSYSLIQKIANLEEGAYTNL